MIAPHPSRPTSVGEPVFELTCSFSAPRALVFQAWTDERQMAQWWGPHGFENVACRLDPRVGGSYHIVMRSPQGIDYPVQGLYREVISPKRLAMTVDCSEHPSEWHDFVRPHRAKDDLNPVGVFLQTVTFQEHEGQTILTITAFFQSPEIRDALLDLGMHEGWSQCLERLAALLTKTQSACSFL